MSQTKTRGEIQKTYYYFVSQAADNIYNDAGIISSISSISSSSSSSGNATQEQNKNNKQEFRDDSEDMSRIFEINQIISAFTSPMIKCTNIHDQISTGDSRLKRMITRASVPVTAALLL